ncbi:MAG: endonuclease III domain-containing protein [Thermovirgaceae bacterium]
MTAKGLFDILLRLYGPQGWWPADSFDELCLGAILVQNTSWNNATLALRNLSERGLLSLKTIAAAPPGVILEAVYPAGTYRRKAFVIKTFSRDFSIAFETAENFRTSDSFVSREWLLARRGIGPETADSILCYGAGEPFLVIDSYTRRLAHRAGLLDAGDVSYEGIQGKLQKDLPKDAAVLGEFHALIVRHGKDFCGKRPSCTICPLKTRCLFPKSCDP